ncbi:uncharacterized protein LOC128234916 [Mya arenaria]|uniref:uncharacterized protein LOC128234916 n=1 Tax=Mya arenaria TaxID=6604 RepID=UPI0022E269EA|nr:uncharacterized protein LOC128234916 [Mya arenaria]
MGQTQTTSIVVNEIAVDSETCDISDICWLSDGKFLLTDRANSRLKILNAAYKFITSITLEGSPFGVCETELSQAAVTCQTPRGPDRIQLISTNNGLTKKGDIEVPCRCNGIAYTGGLLYVCCGRTFDTDDNKDGGHIRLYSLSGTMNYCIPNSSEEMIFYEPLYIVASDDVKHVHVTDAKNGVVTIDTRRNVHYTVPTQSDFTSPRGICETSCDNIIVCDSKSNALVDMILTKTKVEVTVKESGRLENPQAVCFDGKKGNILVACGNSNSIELFSAY